MKALDLVGRDDWLRRLVPLPRVVLLRAPASTGKRTAALWAARQAGVSGLDTQLFPALEYRDEYGRETTADKAVQFVEPELLVGHARELISWARKTPQSSPFKVAVVRMSHERSDGSSWAASPRVQASLLKLLEEPPATTRFVLCATQPPLPMIRSRSVELTGGLLDRDAVSRIVFAVSDLTETESSAVAGLGGGRVGPSLAAQSAEGSVQAVVDVLTSLQMGDHIALTEKARIWTNADTELLNRWAHECVTQRWQVFADSGAPQVSVQFAQQVLEVLRSSHPARPRVVLGAVAALAVRR